MAASIVDISGSVENISDMINKSEDAVHTVAEKSVNVATSTSEGYVRLKDNEESMNQLGEIISKFEV